MVLQDLLKTTRTDGYAAGLKDASDISLSRAHTAGASNHSSAPIREDEALVITLQIRNLILEAPLAIEK